MAPFTCRGGGILPEDRASERRRDQLRRERQDEYRAFLKQQSSNKFRERTSTDSTSGPSTTSYPRPSSVAEKRKTLAQERHQELQSHSKPPLPFPQYKPARAVNEHEISREADNHRRMWPDRGSPHDVLERHHRCSGDERLVGLLAREREIKERDYSGGVAPPQRQRWEERRISNRQVHFDNEYNRDGHQMEPRREYPSQRRHWDEEEEGLMQWARGQGKSKGLELIPPSSPTHLSQSSVKRAGGCRSLSAPVVGGIAALGAGSSEADKKKKQREYAEQLRAQMREKQAAKEREREGISSGTHSQSQHPQQADRGRPSSPWRHSYSNVEEHSSRAFPPRRRERVRFSPERNIHFEPDSTATSSKPPGDPAPFQPYWPGMYYGGYPYPPPGSFPPFPPPQNGLPYYPPPPSLPPSLNTNPYLSPYLPPHYHSDWRQQTTRDRGSNSQLSPRKPMEEKGVEEELNFVLRESDGGNGMAQAKKDSYRLQLLEQMRERNENKQRECLKKRDFERKNEQEVYDPFGKGGCGAPIRDKRGQLVTDLKQMKKVNDERMIIGLPSTTPLPGEVAEGGAAGILDSSFNEPNSPQSSYEFRRSKELRSKSVQDDYKETLEQQMREREEIKRREKNKKSEADKLEKERIERECKMLEENYRLEREKEKELKMRNEALRREEEEREREEAEREREWRQQEALKLEAEKKKQTFIDNMERQLPVEIQPRSSSPPIPTLRKMDPQFPVQTAIPSQPQQQLPTSPPVPTLHHKQLIASNNRGQGGTQEYPNTNGVPPEQQHQRTSTATIRQPDSTKLELLQRSFSAHAAVPQPVNAPNEKAGVSGGSSMNVVGSSRSAQHLPPPHQAEAIPQSISEPHPSSSGVSATYGAPEDDMMENLLRNLSSVRRKLETERQKVIAPKEPDQSTTSGDANAQGPSLPAGVNHNGGNSKPGFWKARLAGHRKNRHTPSHHPPSSENRVPQQSEEERGEDKPRRKQWKLIPRESFPLQISSEHRSDDEDRYSASGTGEETNPHLHPRHARDNNSQRLGGEDRRHVQPPSWLRPSLPRGHDPARGNYDFTDSHSLRPPSVGGESQFSVATLDVDGMARRNEERMRRLESILNSQARDSRTPQSILSDFLARNGQTKDYNQTSSKNGVSSSPANVFTPPDVCQSRESDTSQELDYETGYPVAASTPT